MNELTQVAFMIAGAAGLGTCLGGIGAYMAIRVDFLNMVQRFEDQTKTTDQRFRDMERWIVERFAVAERSNARAHERVDEIMDRLSMPRAPSPSGERRHV